MQSDLIVVKQLPVIEDNLRQIKSLVVDRVSEALSLVVTEETLAAVKKTRASLRKEHAEFEARRIEVKKTVMAPYERFETVYKDCVDDIYSQADKELAARISEVEQELKDEKAVAVRAYFEEYRASLGLDGSWITYERCGVKIGLSTTLTKLKKEVVAYLDGIADDLALIATQDSKDEILVEYKQHLNVSRAITTVNARHEQMEVERAAREKRVEDAAARAAAESRVAEVLAMTEPVCATVPEVAEVQTPNKKTYETSFRVRGTLEQLKALKAFLNDGGYEYEQL